MGEKYIVELPLQGIPQDELIQIINRYLNLGKQYLFHFISIISSSIYNLFYFLGKYNWKDGFISGAVYYYDEELIKLLTEVYGLASYTNPLHSDIFPGICKMEAEIVRLVVNLFHGNSNACGTVCIL